MAEPAHTPPDISCENCVAACCKAPINMQMRQDEYDRHHTTMDLKVVAKPREYPQQIRYSDVAGKFLKIPVGVGLYRLESGCANLTDDFRCSIYASRPQCCRDLEVGSYACLKARRKAGLDADQPPLVDEDGPVSATDKLLGEFFPTSRDASSQVQAKPSAPNARTAYDIAAVRALVARHADWIAERLASCDAPRWTRRTRCTGWTVGDLAAHLVTTQLVTTRLLTAANEGKGASIPPDFAGDQKTTVEAFRTRSRALLDLLARLRPATVEQHVVVDNVETVEVRHLLDVLSTELAVHSLDLADALGEIRHLNTDEIALIARALPDLLDPGTAPPAGTAYVLRSVAFEVLFAFRNGTWRAEPAPDACRIEGDPEALLLFALGRVPFKKSKLTTNQPERARAFKSHLRGP